MNDSSLIITFFIILILGIAYNQLWISLIIGAVLFLLILVPEKKESKKTSPSVIIKPIKVQRKYKEGETIYPKKMEIKFNSGKYKKEERGPEAIGSAIGKSARWLLNLFK